MRRPYISMFHHHHGISVAVLTEDAVDYWQRTDGHDPTNEYELLEEVELPPLYAAAPELLGRLKAMVSGMECECDKADVDHPMCDTCWSQLVIAKAEGRG